MFYRNGDRAAARRKRFLVDTVRIYLPDFLGKHFAVFGIFHFADGKRYVLITQFDFKEIENALLSFGELHGAFSRIGQEYAFVRETTVF